MEQYMASCLDKPLSWFKNGPSSLWSYRCCGLSLLWIIVVLVGTHFEIDFALNLFLSSAGRSIMEQI